MALPTKPTNRLQWMLSAATANISFPTGAKQNTGWAAEEKPAFEHFNGIHYNISQWLELTDDLYDYLDTETAWITSDKLGSSSVTTAKIASSAVTEHQLGNNAVTNLKIGPFAVTTSKIQAGAVTENELGNSAVTTAKLGDSAVTTAKLDTGAVTGAKIANTTIDWNNMVASSIRTTQLADDAVTTAKILDSAVTTAKINSSAVTTDKLGASSVTTAKLADDSVTTVKLKTSFTAAGVAASTSANVTFSGGTYGFNPTIEGTNISVKFCEGYSAVGELPVLHFSTPAGGTANITYRYVTSSGEIPWVFYWREKSTGKIKIKWFSDDHPCFGSNLSPNISTHPFPNHNDSDYEIIVANPTLDEWQEVKNHHRQNEIHFSKAFEQLFEIDETEETNYPDREITIGLPYGYDWRYEKEVNENKIKKAKPIKPDNIKCFKIKRKGV